MSKDRILVLEDVAIIALDVRETLEHEGFEVISCDRIVAAVAAVNATVIDAAILDVAIGTDQAFEVADALTSARIPFIWATACPADELPQPYGSYPCLQKPFASRELIAALRGVLDGATRGVNAA